MPAPYPASHNEHDETSASFLLGHWLRTRLTESDYDWLLSQRVTIEKAKSDRALHIALGLIPRKLGREDLSPTHTELQQADDYASGWCPVNWSIDTTARVWLLSHQTKRGSERFGELVVDLCRTADLAESIAIYSGLPIYPVSTPLDNLVAEGLRSNIKAVFEAIAHHNPYPAIHFSENRWNHMVLKALFVDSVLAPVVGLDARANQALAGTLCDYAHERWAAGRSVSFELWRCVGPFASGAQVDDLAKVATNGNRTEQQAALLALSQCKAKKARNILDSHPLITKRIDNEDLTWSNIGSH